MKRWVVCGKGGVGKTTVSALIARHLDRSGIRSLLVDADHAGGLEVALGFEVTTTLNHLRLEALGELQARDTSRKLDLAASIDYRLMAALVEREQLAFLALGRPEEDGCFCSVNKVLKRALEVLTVDFDVTLVDAEAGIEQINRDVVGRVEYLLLVADTSVKALRVVEAAAAVAKRMDLAEQVGVIFNRLHPDDDREALAARTTLPVVGWLPEDGMVRRFDGEGRSFFELPDCPATVGLAGVFGVGA